MPENTNSPLLGNSGPLGRAPLLDTQDQTPLGKASLDNVPTGIPLSGPPLSRGNAQNEIQNRFDHKLTPVRWTPDYPIDCRCQAHNERGEPCNFLALPFPDGGHTRFCPIHGGSRELTQRSKQTLYNIKVDGYSQRIAEKRKATDAASLGTELALLRTFLEDTLNVCESDYDRIRATPQLQGLIKQINETLLNHLRVQSIVGEVLTRDQVETLIQSIMDAIAEALLAKYPDDYNLLDSIAMLIQSKIA